MQTELLKVTGMTCGGCTNKVTRALKGLPGVGDVSVSLAGGEATVQYDETRLSTDQLERAVTSAGFGVGAASTVQQSDAKRGCCCS